MLIDFYILGIPIYATGISFSLLVRGSYIFCWKLYTPKQQLQGIQVSGGPN
jgi:hypothetical protein